MLHISSVRSKRVIDQQCETLYICNKGLALCLCSLRTFLDIASLVNKRILLVACEVIGCVGSADVELVVRLYKGRHQIATINRRKQIQRVKEFTLSLNCSC